MKKEEPKHLCVACGITQPERKWWNYIIGEELKRTDRKTLVDLILYYKKRANTSL